jgi:hypothetical protein
MYSTAHDAETPISQTIIEAVATVEGVDPLDCDLELYEAVDLEALDALFEHRSSDDHWRFEFAIDEYVVVVEADGDVTICER